MFRVFFLRYVFYICIVSGLGLGFKEPRSLSGTTVVGRMELRVWRPVHVPAPKTLQKDDDAKKWCEPTDLTTHYITMHPSCHHSHHCSHHHRSLIFFFDVCCWLHQVMCLALYAERRNRRPGAQLLPSSGTV